MINFSNLVLFSVFPRKKSLLFFLGGFRRKSYQMVGAPSKVGSQNFSSIYRSLLEFLDDQFFKFSAIFGVSQKKIVIVFPRWFSTKIIPNGRRPEQSW